jgi:hypothetical protein
MGQGRPAPAGDDGLERHAFGASGSGAMFQQGGYRRFRHPWLDLGQEFMEQVDTQSSSLFHQPELFLVLDQAKFGDQGFG